MQIRHKHFILFMFIGISSTVGLAQTPRLQYILDTDATGTTKDYVARDYILLKPNFKYTAVSNQSFKARIDRTITITEPDGTVIKPDGTIIKPDGTIITPEGATIKPDGTIIRADGTIFNTNGTVVNTDGTIAPNISHIVPVVWFKTTTVTSDINGRYKWKDFAPDNIPLLKYNTIGTANPTEYSVGKDSIINYNFNPAIDLSSGNTSKEIIIKKTNLVQATVMGVWGTKKETTNADKFIWALNGRQNESVVFTKGSVISSIESGKNVMIYGNDTTKNLLCQATSTTSDRKARESSLRIGTYFKTTKPNTTVWGEVKKAVISLGGLFSQTNTNNTSTFSTSVSNLGGFKGYSPELLVFDQVLSPIETNIFESYLAIKYGLTLDKSYLSGTGKKIWDYSSNATYNNRITGYGREDLIGLNQKMATTSYQEAPYYSDSCDSYLANNANNLSTRNRLLVMGCQSGNLLKDGEYVLFGDDNNPITLTDMSTPGFITMKRTWLVASNRTSKNWIELSYFDSLATGFTDHTHNTYLLIDRTGTGTFNAASEKYLADSLDTGRSKFIFKNIIWDMNKKNAFTFGYSAPENMGIKKPEKEANEPIDKGDLRIYYPDQQNMSQITIKLQTVKPTVSVILVYDMAGRNVYRKDLPESSDTQYTNIQLPISGVFVVKVINNEMRYSQKVISKK